MGKYVGKTSKIKSNPKKTTMGATLNYADAGAESVENVPEGNKPTPM